MQIVISERIKELMIENGLNQARLASLTGLPRGILSMWLCGKREPSIENLWLLADYFDVTLDYIAGRTDY